MPTQTLLLLVAALALLMGVLVRSLLSPLWGMSAAVFLLAIYWTPAQVGSALGPVFGGSANLPIVADLIFAAIAFAAALGLNSHHRFPVTWLMVVLDCAWIASIINSALPRRSISNIASLVQLTIEVFAIEALVTSETKLKTVLNAWYYSYLAVVAFGVFGLVAGYFGVASFGVMGVQARSTFRFPNQLSLFLVVSLCILSVYFNSPFASRRARQLLWISLLPAALLLLASGSRSGIAAMAAGIGVLVVLRGSRKWAIATIIIAVGAAVIWFRPGASSDSVRGTSSARLGLLDQIASGQASDAFSFYSETDAVAWKSFARYPVFGGGVGAVLDSDITEGQPYEIHNSYVGLLGESGLFGAIAALALFWRLISALLRSRRAASGSFLSNLATGCLAALAGCAVHATANFDWRLRHLWLVVGVASVTCSLACSHRIRTQRAQALTRHQLRAVGA